MPELPEDVADFIGRATGSAAKELRDKYAIEKPLPEWLTYTTYLHDDDDEYLAPRLFAHSKVTLEREEWDKWEVRIGRPLYDVAIKWRFNTRTFEVQYLEFDGKKIVNE